MPNVPRQNIYHLNHQLAVNNYIPEIRHFEFRLLIYLYKEAGYDVARKYLDDLKQFDMERKDPNRVKPEPTNLKYKHENHTRTQKRKEKPGEVSDLIGLWELESGQQQTALRMLKDYGKKVSQNYINSRLNLRKNMNNQIA